MVLTLITASVQYFTENYKRHKCPFFVLVDEAVNIVLEAFGFKPIKVGIRQQIYLNMHSYTLIASSCLHYSWVLDLNAPKVAQKMLSEEVIVFKSNLQRERELFLHRDNVMQLQ